MIFGSSHSICKIINYLYKSKYCLIQSFSQYEKFSIDLAYFINTLVLDVSERVLHEFAHLAIASPFFDSVQQLLTL